MDNERLEELLSIFIKHRDKYKKYRSKHNYARYRSYEALCTDAYDFLVISRVSRYRRFSNYEDLLQEARISLLNALNSFNPKKGDFKYWARQYIKTKVSREANRHSTIKYPMHKAKENQPYKVSQMPIIVDGSKCATDMIESDQAKVHVRTAIEQLPQDQKQIIELNSIRQQSITQISRDLDMTRNSCVQLLNEAKKNLKKNLEEAYSY